MQKPGCEKVMRERERKSGMLDDDVVAGEKQWAPDLRMA